MDTRPSPDAEEVLPRVEDLIRHALGLLRTFPLTRERQCVIVKLQEARMWLREASEQE